MPEADKNEEKLDVVEAVEPPAETVAEGNKFKQFWQGYWHRKKWTLPLTVMLLLAVLAGVPQTRYPIFALWMQRDVQLTVLDDGTKKPVASARITLDEHWAITDNKGQATIKAKVGQRHVTVAKKYYADADTDVFVGVKGGVRTQVTIKATGRQVPLKVSNKLTGKPIENALIKAAETEVKTDKDGKAVLVLPAGKTTLAVEVSSDKFNTAKGTLTVTESEVPGNSYQLTPNGKVYFLSKKSGKIDVVKTDLDGGDRQTVVAGTGREDERGTVLLASRNWRYLAFLSRRESDLAKLYLIDTTNDKMTTMDEGNANFDLVGWNDNVFVYKVTRNNVKYYEANRIALKSFDASNSKLATLDQSEVMGDQNNYAVQDFASPYLVGDRAVYAAQWSGSTYLVVGKTSAIRSVTVTGKDKKDLKTFPADKYYSINGRLYKPREIYFAAYNSGSSQQEYYEYEAGVVKPTKLASGQDFYSTVYPTYLLSPSGKRVFWSEQRDGRDTFFTGNLEAEDTRQVVTLDEHQVYGWYNDDYLLLSKKGSELYIMPVDGGQLTKVTDYHKPQYSYVGYGGGYGGL